jgi:hypothetical protein
MSVIEEARQQAEALLEEALQYTVQAALDDRPEESTRWLQLARSCDLLLDAVRLMRASVAELEAGIRE